jgi:hypothetical protein
MDTPFDKFQTLETPAQEPQGEPTQQTGTEPTQQPAAQTGEPTTPQAGEPPKVDEFIETINKKFNTQYKAEDELKSIFDLPKKISEYEGRLKDYDALKTSNEKYKSDLESLSRTEAEKYLSDPIMQKAWVVKELKVKYPNSDVSVLTDLAMADIDKMDDVELLAKEIKMKLPTRSLDAIKSVVLDEIGVDATTDPKEWDEKALTKLAIKASAARENIKNLLGGIQLPKVETKEEAQARVNATLAKRTEQAASHRADYLKFDEFKVKDDLKYTVPEEFKAKLGDMFDAFVLKAGNDPTPENLETLNDLREAFFYNTYKDKIYEVIYKDAESRVKAELDKKLGNTTLPNTATASDGAGTAANEKDGSEFLRSLKNEGRATRL